MNERDEGEIRGRDKGESRISEGFFKRNSEMKSFRRLVTSGCAAKYLIR